jgi:hypothetical protein
MPTQAAACNVLHRPKQHLVCRLTVSYLQIELIHELSSILFEVAAFEPYDFEGYTVKGDADSGGLQFSACLKQHLVCLLAVFDCSYS